MNLPPPMPDWTDLISRMPPAKEKAAYVPSTEKPCCICGTGKRAAVRKYGKVITDSYCLACRKDINARNYRARVGAPIH